MEHPPPPWNFQILKGDSHILYHSQLSVRLVLPPFPCAKIDPDIETCCSV